MEQTITTQIPRGWITGVPEEELTLQYVFRLGVYQYNVERAIKLYQNDMGSLGFIARQLNLPKQDLIHEFRLRGIEPDFSEETVQEELGE
jgi:hypothetical protein